jgi:DNA-binding CsgD family transcriptional regulator
VRRSATQDTSGLARQRKASQPGRPRSARRPGLSPWGCGQEPDCFVQQAVTGLSIGMILIDPRGRVVWLNRAAEQLLDMRADQCVGRAFTKILLDPQLAAFWHEVMCRDGNCMADVSIRWPHHLELKLNATQCLDREGVEIGRALLFCDVTSDRNVKIEMTREMADWLRNVATPPSTAPALVSDLTSQEMRSLRLVGRGMSNEAIADKLCVAPSTVRSHLKSAYRKLGLRTRAEAVSFALRQRLT